MDAFQFYPTPAALANKAWKTFRNKNIERVLEPSAGEGHLLNCKLEKNGYSGRYLTIDCFEIDASKHPILREKKINVIGLDFMEMSDGAIYDGIIMNPPFAEGAKHVLHAWKLLWDGEIVALLNAETIRNPFSKERKELVALIEKYGEVEYLPGAFKGADVEREADVDVALVYLCKEADAKQEIFGDLFRELKEESATHERLAAGFANAAEVALPNTTIENAVLTFNAAVRSMRESTFMEARARYYSAMLGETMAVRNSGGSTKKDGSVRWVQSSIAERYAELKDKAWANILRSTNVISKLSSKAQKRLESEFEQIKKLEFTVSNVYGFLCGLVEKQGEIQIDMCCDVFDAFTKYHSENTVFYKGWKSNDKHRKCGMRLRTTRVILPGHGRDSFYTSLSWDSERMLADFDKVFAMLDGKREPEFGLVQLFKQHLNELRRGERMSSSYFDIRYYPGAGTIHFYATSKTLIDRLNRLVGRQRSWLPPESERINEAFWLQYDSAEKFDKEIRTEMEKLAKASNAFGWAGPLASLCDQHGHDPKRKEIAEKLMDQALSKVLNKHGVNPDFQITGEKPSTLLLEAA